MTCFVRQVLYVLLLQGSAYQACQVCCRDMQQPRSSEAQAAETAVPLVSPAEQLIMEVNLPQTPAKHCILSSQMYLYSDPSPYPEGNLGQSDKEMCPSEA